MLFKAIFTTTDENEMSDTDMFRDHIPRITEIVIDDEGEFGDLFKIHLTDFYDIDTIQDEEDSLGWNSVGPQFFSCEGANNLFINSLSDGELVHCGYIKNEYVYITDYIVLWEDHEEGPECALNITLQKDYWGYVRRMFNLRSTVLYWLHLTEHLMSPNGSARKRDCDEFEQEALAFLSS